MKYLIAQEWQVTKDNHAGVVHMVKLLAERYPENYRIIIKDCPPERKVRKNPITRRLLSRYDNEQYRKKWVSDYLYICQNMFSEIRKGDEVFLLEYNWPPVSQYELACYIKSKFEEVKIYALSHLTPTYFNMQNNAREHLLLWDKPVDKHMTLGSSLSYYFESIGIPRDKISTGLYFADIDYYKAPEKEISDRLTIIAMGFLQRDFGMLADIVNHTSNVDWIICRGKKAELDQCFAKTSNVEMKGFMEEDELREQMAKADVSMNVMEDTVGSNVITTSMSMGLALLVSDVGSIRDYCDESNAIFCQNTTQSFVDAINQMAQMSKDKLFAMRKNSINKASQISIERVNRWFSSISQND